MAPAAGKGPNRTGTYYHQPQYPPQQQPALNHHGGESSKLKQEGAYFSSNPSEPYSGPPRPEQVGGPAPTPLSAAAIASHGHGHGRGVYGSFAAGAGSGSGAGLASGDDDDATSPSSQGHGGYERTLTPQPGSGGSTSKDERNGRQGGGSTTSTNPKKRKTIPGSRGVANLTPEQLAKKRANDREAQRAIRERQKLKNEQYEREIRELKSQQPYQELQAALRQKAAVEAELAEMKRTLASVVSMVQPLISRPDTQPAASIGSSPHDGGQTQPATSIPPPPAPSFTVGSTPVSAASPASVSNQGGRWQNELSPVATQATAARPVPAAGDYPEARVLEQQRLELVHGLDLGSERLELDFLIGPTQKIPKIQSGINGAQDSPNYRHVPLKHDWTDGPDPASTNPQTQAPAVVQRFPPPIFSDTTTGTQQTAPAQITVVPAAAVPPPPPPSQPPLNAIPRIGQSQQHPSSSIPPSLPNPNPSPDTGTGGTPPWFLPLKNCAPTCALDSLLLDFLAERRERQREGLPLSELVGPRYPSVSSLLNPAVSRRYAHPLSKLFTDVVSTFPHLSTLPERIAVVHGMFLIMRWQIDPTRENWLAMPPHFRPLPIQQSVSHPAWLDYIAFPDMRRAVITEWENNDRSFTIDEFFIPFTSTLNLSWPYEETDTLLMSPDGSEVMINPVYERHMSRLSSWTLGEAYARTFPRLVGTFNLRRDGS
ncbi:AP-1-like transcription factor [Naviculisporaceae sp. PSN 640]